MTELKTHASVLTALGQQLDDIGTDVRSFIDGAPDFSGALNSHGTIGALQRPHS